MQPSYTFGPSNKKDAERKLINDIITKYTIHSPQSEPDATAITNLIWLGNYKAAHDIRFLTKHNIRYIINITPNIDNKFSNSLSYLVIPIKDKIANKHIPQLLKQAAQTIDTVVNAQQPILVHCKQGHHRSATAVALYLLLYQQMTLPQAVEYIKQKRQCAFRRLTRILDVVIDWI